MYTYTHIAYVHMYIHSYSEQNARITYLTNWVAVMKQTHNRKYVRTYAHMNLDGKYFKYYSNDVFGQSHERNKHY